MLAIPRTGTLDDANVRCWGRSNVGQLGYGSTTSLGDNEKPSAASTVNIGGKVIGDNEVPASVAVVPFL